MTSVENSMSAALKALSQKPVIPDAFKPDPEKAKEAEKLSATLRQVAKSMRNSGNEIGKSRKAMAAQKVAMLKQMIKALRQYAGADPKTVARMAKQLARDLAAAIKEYAAAGATFSEIASTAGDSVSPQNISESSEKPQESENSSETVDVPQEAAEPFAREANAYAKAGEQKTEEHGLKLSFDEEDGTVRVKDDDSTFIKEAKDLMDELKRIIKSLRPRLAAWNDQDGKAEKEVREAENALEDLGEEFSHMLKALS